MAKRYAVIDMGTNTFHLLVADYDGFHLNQLYAEKVGVRLGKREPHETGGITAGTITPSAIGRAKIAMESFALKMREFGLEPSQAQAFGTSALRNAANGHEVAHELTAATGIPVSIIDGQEEASLIYNGVKHSFKFSSLPNLIMDIGGGSVEFILADENGPLWQHSFEVGGQRLMDRFMQQDPISDDMIIALETWLDQELASLWAACAQHPPAVLIGSAGTFETLADMCFFKLHAEHMPFEESTWEDLPLGTVMQLTNELSVLSREERLKVPGMIELRADMSVVAMLLLRHVINKLEVKRLVASVYALKEGVFYRLVAADQA